MTYESLFLESLIFTWIMEIPLMYAIIRIAERTDLLKRTISGRKYREDADNCTDCGDADKKTDGENGGKKADRKDNLNVNGKENLKEKISEPDIFAAGILMTALTLPYLWFIMPVYLDMSWYPVNGEIIVAAVESVIIWYMLKIRLYQAVIIAIIVNSVSYGLGLLI
ncbi:hypothetical protein [Methanoplanus limicola]|uniref:Uncharacterized protein n=1 Tax=Methanoplanus limicola DSM 2279 TaxID=937775 RepID=H1Z2V1_9EURY|nr:hypothetical protein [Methanoplanus limicola]EHQ34690.1 hypothetical protein Metlim_0556 [Methanoplanus limicola DSM 2279]